MIDGKEVDNTAHPRRQRLHVAHQQRVFADVADQRQADQHTRRRARVPRSTRQQPRADARRRHARSTHAIQIEDGSTGASFSHKTFRGAPQAIPGSPGGCDVTPDQTPRSEIFVNVLPRSSVARTVYVRCGGTREPIVVTATRMVLDSDPAPRTAMVHRPRWRSTPILRIRERKGRTAARSDPRSHNPDAENPDAENPDAENPDAENPDAENPDAENPDAENPDAENPDAENPDAENPDAENPDAENPDAENANFQDVTVDVTNDGDTTSGYQVQGRRRLAAPATTRSC